MPPHHAWLWLREALALTARRPLAYVVLALGYGALLRLPGIGGDLAFIATPLGLGVACVIASATDANRTAIDGIRQVRWVAWLRLLLSAIGVLALVLGLSPAWDRIALLFGPDPNAVLAPPGSFDAGVASLWFWFLLFGLTLWFVIPLLLIAGLPLRQALEQSIAGFMLNRFMIVVYASLGATLSLALIVPLVALPWFAIVSATLYTSYRDVWLGRTRNRAIDRAAALERTTVASRHTEITT